MLSLIIERFPYFQKKSDVSESFMIALLAKVISAIRVFAYEYSVEAVNEVIK